MKKTLTLMVAFFGFVIASLASTIPTYEPFADATGVTGGTAYTSNTMFLSHQTNALLDGWWGIDTGTANANSNLTTSVIITNITLSYAGLPASTGNALVIPRGTAGMGARIFLTNGASPIPATGYVYGTNANGVTVYYSLIMQVPNISHLSSTGDYCFGFNNQQTIAEQTANPGNWAGKVFFRTNAAGYNLGVSKMGTGAATATFDSTIYSTSDTIFVVVGYTINSANVGTPGDDVVKLWINPSAATFGSLTPPSATVTGISATDSDQNNGGLDCFQFGVRSATQPDLLVIDELRIGTNWAQVTGGPFFKTFPGNTSVNYSSTLTLSSKASGNGLALTYQWQQNGANLTDGGNVSGSTTSALTIANATQATAGTYSLILNNTIGSATNSNVVTITGDPRVLTNPSGVAAAPGSSTTFAITATGTPTLTYQWKRNGINLTDGAGLTATTYAGSQTATLTLNTIDLADNNALYSCAVTNANNLGVVSSSATLTVNDPSITAQPVATSVNFGGTTNFSVSAVGTATLSYQWFRGATALSNGDSGTGSGAIITGSTLSTLTISGASYLDAASYSVIVTNGLGATVSSSSVALTVKDPYIVTQPTAATVLVGNSANFTVSASGSPTLSYQWLKGSTSLANGLDANGSTITGATTPNLTIDGTASADAGSYKVIVTNGANLTVTSSSVVLTVQTPASVTVVAARRTQRVGDHLTFIANTAGTTPFTYQWDLNGTPISGATASTLSLNNIQTSDAGSYNVTVNNPVGTPATGTGMLNVSTGYLPLSTANLIVARVGDGSQTLNNTVGNTLYLDQLQTDGTYVSTIMIPDQPTSSFGTDQSIANVPVGTNVMMAASGSSDATYESVLTRSANGDYINFGAYNTSVPSLSVLTGVVRGFGAVNALGYYQLTYTNKGFYSGGDSLFRSICSDDGLTNFWTTGAASSAGVKYGRWFASYANGNNVPPVSGSFTNTRVVDVVGVGSGLTTNVVFTDWGDNSSTTTVGLNAFAGVPKPSGAVASTNIIPMTSGAHPLDFAFSPDLQTVYIADDRTFANGGGIQRWDTNAPSGGWSLSYTLTCSNTLGARSLVVDWSANSSYGSNVVGAVLYATSASASKNSLMKIVDNGAGSTGTAILTGGANQLLRGVRFGPAQAPVITVSAPTDKTAATGSSSVFTIGVTGDAPFTYQWYKGATLLSNGATGSGSSIAGSSTASLTVVNASATDAATYSVIVSDAIPSAVTNSAILTVIDGVTITSPPTSATANYGDTVTFSGVATGGGTLTYKWKKNGVNLTDGGNISGSSSGTLTLTNVTFVDHGSYSLVVSNEANSASSTAILTVNDPAVTSPSNVSANAGDNVTFGCVATGSGTLTFAWSRNGTPLADGANATTATYAGTQTATLSINGVGQGDEASYTCIVSGSGPAVTTAAATLTVQDPFIVSSPVSLSLVAGHSATFSITALGTGVTYQWLKDGNPISGEVASSTTIPSVSAGDAGGYSCVVTGPDGSLTSSSGTLTLIDPVSLGGPDNATNGLGQTQAFTVVASGTGPFTYSWTKDGNPLTDNASTVVGAATASLSITNLQNSDAGSYAVTVNNADSTASSTAMLVVLDPYIVTSPQSTTIDCNGNGCLSVAAVGTGTLTYQWYTPDANGTAITDATNSTLCFTNAAIAPAASYVVAVTGDNGSVTSSVATVTVQDTVAPIITVTAGPSTTCVGSGYSDPGATANDACEGSVSVSTSGSVNTGVAGAYTLTYSASDTSLNNSTATRVVSVVPCGDPLITSQPANVVAATGSNVVFSITAVGTGPLKYQWFFIKNGTTTPKKMVHSAVIPAVTNDTLSINKVSGAASGGSYYCVVSNALHSITNSANATLTVHDAPVVKIIPPFKTLLAGYNFKMVAKVTKGALGQTVSYQWQKAGSSISNATNSTYSLVNVQTNDGAIYTCVVNNDSPTVGSNSCPLTVTQDTDVPKVVLLKKPTDASAKPGLKPGDTPADATGTNQAPNIDFLGEAVDKGLIVSAYLSNAVNNATFPVTFVKKPSDYTATNTSAGKPAFFLSRVSLVDGTNIFYGVATDSDGNATVSKATHLFYISNPQALTIATAGTGHVTSVADLSYKNFGTPANGAVLAVGHNYTIKATATGHLVTFGQWVLSDPSALISTNATSATINSLTFQMKTNLSITAKFSNAP